jgi:hypothetical protein
MHGAFLLLRKIGVGAYETSLRALEITPGAGAAVRNSSHPGYTVSMEVSLFGLEIQTYN